MRWLFALFITVSCWASLVSGNMLLPPHSTPSGAALSALSTVYSDNHCASYSLSSFHALSAKLRLQNQDVSPQLRLVGVSVKKTAIKNRLSAAQFTGSANLSLLNNTWPAAYLLSHAATGRMIFINNHGNRCRWLIIPTGYSMQQHSKIVWAVGKRAILNTAGCLPITIMTRWFLCLHSINVAIISM